MGIWPEHTAPPSSDGWPIDGLAKGRGSKGPVDRHTGSKSGIMTNACHGCVLPLGGTAGGRVVARLMGMGIEEEKRCGSAPLQPLDFAAAAGWTVEECGYLRRALYFNRYRCGRGCGRATDGALDLGLWLEPCRRYQYTYLGTYGNMRAIIYQYHGPASSPPRFSGSACLLVPSTKW